MTWSGWTAQRAVDASRRCYCGQKDKVFPADLVLPEWTVFSLRWPGRSSCPEKKCLFCLPCLWSRRSCPRTLPKWPYHALIALRPNWGSSCWSCTPTTCSSSPKPPATHSHPTRSSLRRSPACGPGASGRSSYRAAFSIDRQLPRGDLQRSSEELWAISVTPSSRSSGKWPAYRYQEQQNHYRCSKWDWFHFRSPQSWKMLFWSLWILCGYTDRSYGHLDCVSDM